MISVTRHTENKQLKSNHALLPLKKLTNSSVKLFVFGFQVGVQVTTCCSSLPFHCNQED